MRNVRHRLQMCPCCTRLGDPKLFQPSDDAQALAKYKEHARARMRDLRGQLQKMSKWEELARAYGMGDGRVSSLKVERLKAELADRTRAHMSSERRIEELCRIVDQRDRRIQELEADCD